MRLGVGCGWRKGRGGASLSEILFGRRVTENQSVTRLSEEGPHLQTREERQPWVSLAAAQTRSPSSSRNVSNNSKKSYVAITVCIEALFSCLYLQSARSLWRQKLSLSLISRVSSLAVKIYSAVEASVSSNLKALLNPTCVVCPKPSTPSTPGFNHNHNCSALRVGRIWWNLLIPSHVLRCEKKIVFVLHFFFNTYFFHIEQN